MSFTMSNTNFGELGQTTAIFESQFEADSKW